MNISSAEIIDVFQKIMKAQSDDGSLNSHDFVELLFFTRIMTNLKKTESELTKSEKVWSVAFSSLDKYYQETPSGDIDFALRVKEIERDISNKVLEFSKQGFKFLIEFLTTGIDRQINFLTACHEDEGIIERRVQKLLEEKEFSNQIINQAEELLNGVQKFRETRINPILSNNMILYKGIEQLQDLISHVKNDYFELKLYMLLEAIRDVILGRRILLAALISSNLFEKSMLINLIRKKGDHAYSKDEAKKVLTPHAAVVSLADHYSKDFESDYKKLELLLAETLDIYGNR